MKPSVEFYRKADAAYQKAQAIYESAMTAGRPLTKDEAKEAERLTGEGDAFHEQGEGLEHVDDRREGYRKPVGVRPGASGCDSGDAALGQRLYGRAAGATMAGNANVNSRSFSGMFPNVHPTSDGFKSFGEFLKLIATGQNDPRLKFAVGGASGTVPSEGGMSIPVEYASWLLDMAMENEIIRPRATIIPMTTNQKQVTNWENYDHSTNLYGGFSANWAAEGETLAPQIPKLESLTFSARKLALYAAATSELLADSTNYERELTIAMAKAIGFTLDQNFLTGAGGPTPVGILNSDALITVDKETNQTADTILYANIIKMIGRLHPSCFANAVWICHPSAIPQLLDLGHTIGVAGESVRVMNETNGELRLMTRPVLISEQLSAIGDVGDIVLADISKYGIGLRADVQIARSEHALFSSDQVSFRVILRVDGKALWTEAVQPVNGPTLAPFVTLAAR